jgi:hypothetical protein
MLNAYCWLLWVIGELNCETLEFGEQIITIDISYHIYFVHIVRSYFTSSDVYFYTSKSHYNPKYSQHASQTYTGRALIQLPWVLLPSLH